jgi:DNA polymerase III subunit epsilon
MRQVVLDTETTGLEVKAGHRIIEIGCVEIVDRRITERRFQRYVNPGRDIDAGAIEVHGITNERLANEPAFADVCDDFIKFVDGAELLIHNAAFDVGFLNQELKLLGREICDIAAHCKVVDTLAMARGMYEGQRCSLDALCKRLEIDNSQRTLHGALLDAEILAEVYLAMTGGQTALSLDGLSEAQRDRHESAEPRRDVERVAGMVLAVVGPTDDERAAHEALVAELGPGSLWNRA